MKRAPIVAFALPMMFASSAVVADAANHSMQPMETAQANAQSAALSEGEVRKVDPANGKVTIRHGELKNLDMPAMTMVFRVKDPAMLANIKAGDKIKFRAEKINGALTVVEMQPAS